MIILQINGPTHALRRSASSGYTAASATSSVTRVSSTTIDVSTATIGGEKLINLKFW